LIVTHLQLLCPALLIANLLRGLNLFALAQPCGLVQGPTIEVGACLFADSGRCGRAVAELDVVHARAVVQPDLGGATPLKDLLLAVPCAVLVRDAAILVDVVVPGLADTRLIGLLERAVRPVAVACVLAPA